MHGCCCPGKGSRQHPYLSLPRQCHWTCWVICGPLRRAACVTAWMCCRVLFWEPLKTSNFSDHSLNGPKWHTQIRNMLPPKSKEAHRTLCLSFFFFFFGYRQNKTQQCTLCLRRDASPHWTPGNLTKVEGPWIFVAFISHPPTHKCLTNKSRVVVASCSPGPIASI